MSGRLVSASFATCLCWPVVLAGQATESVAEAPQASEYVLGPGDQIRIQVLHLAEVAPQPVRIDPNGLIRVALAGSVRAAGLSVRQLESELSSRLKLYTAELPEVEVSIIDFQSKPVSVLGAVRSPGVQQLRGAMTLVEVLSLAGGLTEEAGHALKITRQLNWGTIPLPTAKQDPASGFATAEVNVRDLIEGKNLEQNIFIKPHDIISVPRASIVYVIGDVKKAGGFVLKDRETVSVLQMLAKAEGLQSTAAPHKARILRPVAGEKRKEIAVDVKDVLEGKAADAPLYPDDILFIPTSASKKALYQALQTGLSIGTGIAIWR